MSHLTLYAHPGSQPSRTLIWACALEELPITLVTDHTAAANNPRGQLPFLDDDGFILSEMPAILTYLATTQSWTDLYPVDPQIQAEIAQYLHAHHSMTRLATLKLMAPHISVAFGGVPTDNALSYINNTTITQAMQDPQLLANGQDLIGQILAFLERSYLAQTPFLARTQGPSLADLACYEEVSQLSWAGLMDLSVYPLVSSWLTRMQALPWHDEIHAFNTNLGDIVTQPNTLERFAAATDAALQALAPMPTITLG